MHHHCGSGTSSMLVYGFGSSSTALTSLCPSKPSVPGPGGHEALTLPCGDARAQVMHKRHDHMIFYDCWVARDAGGLPFANNRPFVAHQYSRLRLEAGQPFPVSCCWNGMAVINAAPFRKGIRFRRAWGAALLLHL